MCGRLQLSEQRRAGGADTQPPPPRHVVTAAAPVDSTGSPLVADVSASAAGGSRRRSFAHDGRLSVARCAWGACSLQPPRGLLGDVARRAVAPPLRPSTEPARRSLPTRAPRRQAARCSARLRATCGSLLSAAHYQPRGRRGWVRGVSEAAGNPGNTHKPPPHRPGRFGRHVCSVLVEFPKPALESQTTNHTPPDFSLAHSTGKLPPRFTFGAIVADTGDVNGCNRLIGPMIVQWSHAHKAYFGRLRRGHMWVHLNIPAHGEKSSVCRTRDRPCSGAQFCAQALSHRRHHLLRRI